MATLSVRDFSCIKTADLDIRPMTVLIGPQASGKSVLTKLLYFFSDILRIQHNFAQEGNNIRLFKREIARKFTEWFPPSAWGKAHFVIEYKAGLVHFTAKRRQGGSRVFEEVEIGTSKFFDDQYEALVNSYRVTKKRRSEDDEFSFASFDKQWQVQNNSAKYLREVLKRDFISRQIFIPAGRSFFTNLGKAVAMLEHGNQLDELSKRFGRLFTSLLDGDVFFYGEKPSAKVREFLSKQKLSLSKVFGGIIKISQNDRHVDTEDGRKIPFAILSSGQQELLPLLLIMQHFTRSLVETPDASSTEMMYVEEPEAHLFPSAQGALIEHMAVISNYVKDRASFVITTHSPYVLATLNNLIKAFSVSAQATKKLDSEISELVSKTAWIAPGAISAYALQKGILTSIKDDSGLLDGSYLDSISNDISSVFLGLLEMEARND